MLGYPDTPLAWWLTRGMARIAGVNLSRAVVEGRFTQRDLGALVSRCAHCPRSALCEPLLTNPGPLPEIPQACPNKADLETLAQFLTGAPAPDTGPDLPHPAPEF